MILLYPCSAARSLLDVVPRSAGKGKSSDARLAGHVAQPSRRVAALQPAIAADTATGTPLTRAPAPIASTDEPLAAAARIAAPLPQTATAPRPDRVLTHGAGDGSDCQQRSDSAEEPLGQPARPEIETGIVHGAPATYRPPRRPSLCRRTPTESDWPGFVFNAPLPPATFARRRTRPTQLGPGRGNTYITRS
jgi:hypothetical protein